MVRKIFKGISFTIAVIVIVGIILTGLFRNPNVQTYLARAAAIHLSEYLDTQIKIEKLRISAFLNLTASGIEIHDLNNKQMLTLKQLLQVRIT